MSERAPRLPVWSLAAVVTAATAAAAGGAGADPAALLAATDLFAAAPAELRLALEVGVEGRGERSPLELWRRGDQLALVRFLAPAERGKFVLRRDGETWFLAPGARRPVRMGGSFRLHGGAALDDLLGLSLARDYRVAAHEERRGVATLDLEAVASGAAYPRIRWVVDAARRRPLRAELAARGGKALRTVEFRSWLDAARLIPGELAVADLVRRVKLVVRFLEVEARPVPEALFDLDDPSARAALEER